MSKINIPPIKDGFNLSKINDAFATVVDHLNNKVFYRDNPVGETNEVLNHIDMTGNRIYNLPEPVGDSEPLRKKDIANAQNLYKSLRVEDTQIPAFPDATFRRNKLMSFDNEGNPQVQFPSADSATQLRIDLAANDGASLIGIAPASNLYERISEYISVKDFGAKGDALYQRPSDGKWFSDAVYTVEATDDYPAIQAAFNKARDIGGARVLFPAGGYLCRTGSPQVFSNTIVEGVGKALSYIVQPNYYRYDRPTVPYNSALVVDWNALWMDVTTNDVLVEKLGLFGPFYRKDDDYTTYPVENWPASNGIHHRGNDYEFRKSLPYSVAGGFNVVVTDCHLEGWAEEGIQIDLVENLHIYRNKIRRCGRGGVRTIGALHAWIDNNDIYYINPGDYLNSRTVDGVTIGGNRAYGIEATRVYQAGCRPSEDIWITNNRIRYCLQWKCMGTHGGRRIRFLFNDCADGHHGVGVDKGGFTPEHGISPPSDVWIIGNRFVRNAAPDPNEGDQEGGPGQAIFVTAHDQTDTHVGRGLIVHSNFSSGWGTDNLTGGAWLGNWVNVQWGQNTWQNCLGTAIRLRDRVDELVMAPQIIKDMRVSSANQLRGIGVESANVRGMLQGGFFTNNLGTALTAFYLANPAAGMGVSILPGSRFVGNVSETNIPTNIQGGGAVGLLPTAVGNILSVTGTASIRVGRGIASVAWESTGSYLITLNNSASNMNNLVVNVNCISTNRTAYWEAVSANSFRVKVVAAGTTTPADNSFTFSVHTL